MAISVVYWRTLRIRRRRAQDVADTTDSLRAVACIRFVRPWFVMVAGHDLGLLESLVVLKTTDKRLECIGDWCDLIVTLLIDMHYLGLSIGAALTVIET